MTVGGGRASADQAIAQASTTIRTLTDRFIIVLGTSVTARFTIDINLVSRSSSISDDEGPPLNLALGIDLGPSLHIGDSARSRSTFKSSRASRRENPCRLSRTGIVARRCFVSAESLLRRRQKTQGHTKMRFIMIMIPSVYQPQSLGQKADVGFAPDPELVEKMTRFNEDLANSGAMLAGDGFQPPAVGARVSYSDGTPSVAHGPWPDAKDIVGGYWLIQAKSLDEAIDWAKKIPAQSGDKVEVRQVFEMFDFPEDVQAAAESPILKEHLEKVKG